VTPAHPLRFLQFRARIVKELAFWQSDFWREDSFQPVRMHLIPEFSRISNLLCASFLSANKKTGPDHKDPSLFVSVNPKQLRH
jgi:hypothetical protein